MAGFSVQGATVTFAVQNEPVVAVTATRLSVETPEAEITDMTSAVDLLGANVMVPTGDTSPGTVSVDFISTAQLSNPQALTGKVGVIGLSAQGYTVSRNAVLQSATLDHQIGDIVRGSMRFTVTDYYPAPAE